MNRMLSVLAIVVLTSVALTSPLLGQTASINGTVADSTGAVVDRAKVIARNTSTNATREAETSTSGVFNITELPAGLYQVTVQKEGFRMAVYQNVMLTVDQALTLNGRLDVGSTSEQVTVEGNSIAAIDTTDAEVSNVIDEKQMAALPLILRDPYQLVLLAPGTTQTNSGLGGFSINGGRERDNNFQLDGTDNNDPGVPGNGLATLNPDATQEFRVITNNYLPEFGRDSSAVIDIISRSGTNQVHGDVYYFGRWNALGARDYFNPESTTGRQNSYERNTFGGSVGGPILKNKAFFFFNFEGNRFRTATTTTAQIPTPAFRTGVFTYTDAQAGPINIDVSRPGSANNAFGLALDPQMQKVFNFFPAVPNGPPVIPGVAASYLFADPDILHTNNYLAKVDYTVTARNNLSVRYLANEDNDNGEGLDILPGIGGVATHGRLQSANAHLTTTFTSSRQSDLFASANRSATLFPCDGISTIDALNNGGVDAFGRGVDWTLPVAFTPISCIHLGDSDLQKRAFGTYTVGDNLTWIKGRHTWKFGFEFADNYENNFNDFGTRVTPNFSIYSNTFISPLQNTPAFDNPEVQDAVWSLLGGVFQNGQTQLYNTTGTRVPTDERGFRERDIYGFWQDQFKLKSNFTLSYGMRYEWDGVPWVVNNELTSASPAALAGPGPIQFVTVTRGGQNPLYVNDTHGFEPRIGFAWAPFNNGKTSLRGGYGIFRDREFFNLTGDTRANPPFSLGYLQNVYLGQGPATAADQISHIPIIPATQPTPPSYMQDGELGFPATIDPNFHVPYVQQWNLGIQKELGGHFVFELNYVGNKANRLHRVVDGNAPNPTLVAQLRAYCRVPNAFGCVDSPNASPNVETVQGLFLYEGKEFGLLPFDAVQNSAAFHSNEIASVANSNDHALQASLNRQFSKGMLLKVNYTWAHAIDDAADAFFPQQTQFQFPANSFFLRREKGNSAYDVRHRAVISYVAELPFGRGKNILNSGIAGRALEGWSWSGIATLQTGFPVDILENGVDSDGTGGIPQRASYAPAPISSQTYLAGFPATGPNPALFMFPLYGGPGTVHRNTFYGPGYKNFDMVLAKTMRFSERFNLEFRSEYYNIFNHPNFQQPDEVLNDLGGTFGVSTAEVGRNDGTSGARQLQFGMKLHF